jgi:nitrite reductase/ring-hydroxylating ferredoxin subunit
MAADPEGMRVTVGRAADLEEGGLALRFQCAQGEPAFVVRFRGRIHAWVNRCPHQGTELDWAPGEVFSADRQHLVCASHDAHFEPDSGRCVRGPCRGAALQALVLEERDGELSYRIATR